MGALKRKFKTGKKTEPGQLIALMNEAKKSNIKKSNQTIPKQKLEIMGLV